LDRLLEYEPIVGVDIAPDFIRAAQIERVGDEYYLRNIGIKETPPDCIEEGRIIRTGIVAKAIKELYRERQFNTKKVYAAVRGKGVISRMITLPSLPHERLGRLIETEVNRYVIFSEDDKVVYYHPIEEFDEQDRRKVSILLVVAQKSLCRSYYETFREAGLELAGLDLSTLSIMRELRNSQSYMAHGSTMALIFDQSTVSMNIFGGDIMRFSRSINTGNVSAAELTNGYLNKLIGEVLLALHFYQSEFSRGDMVQRLILSSGSVEGNEIYTAIQESAGSLPVEVHSPFANIKLNMDDFPASIMEQVDSKFLTSVGLALRGQELEVLPFQVDLMPPEIAENKILRKHFWVFVRCAMVLVFLCVISAFMLTRFEDRVKSETQLIGEKKAQVKSEIIRLSARQKDSLKLNPLPADTQVTTNLSPLLEEVKKVIPKTVQLTALRMVDSDSVEFEGIAESNTSIFYFVSSLKNSKFFKDIELGPHSPVKAFDREMVGFVIRCSYTGGN
jgi:Tfp pilus assembly PilM family ATPase/Tfp pilus assembly protein PilN